MPRLEVETDDLASLSRYVLEAARSLTEADLGGAARWAAAALPGADSASALDECAELCRHLARLLNANLETLFERLSAAASAYEAADRLAVTRPE